MIDVKLAEYIEEIRKTPFEWGKCDCVLFASDWAERLVGRNPVKGIRGKYTTEEEAEALLEAEYNSKPEDHVDLFFERINPNFAQKGDVALCELNEKRTFGIVGARGFVFFKMGEGILGTKRIKKLIVWRVE